MARRVPPWQPLYGDVSDDDGKIIRQVGIKAFQIIEWIDMDDACGRDNEGQPRFWVGLELVDLGRLSVAQIEMAWGSCGGGRSDAPPPLIGLAEACRSYGMKAPLWSTQSNARVRSIREAKHEANALLDPDALRAALGRPVNKLGSTADEFMRGDLDSAVERGVRAGDPDALLVNKIQGGPEPWKPTGISLTHLVEAPPIDWLPYMMGYMEGLNGVDITQGNDLVRGYKDGHARGVAVRLGRARPPTWLKMK